VLPYSGIRIIIIIIIIEFLQRHTVVTSEALQMHRRWWCEMTET